MVSRDPWAVIPARYGSRRLPGKALCDVGGLPMVERVRRRAAEAGCFARVVVATDDERIAAAVEACGGEVVRTGPAPSGTHRVWAAARALGADRVVNVQGDLPLVPPDHLGAVCAALRDGAVVTLAAPLEDASDPARVKVVWGDGRVLFTRRPLPVQGPWWAHIGVYGFGAGALERCVRADRAPAEVEDLEQVAWVESGVPVRVLRVDRATPSVDTPSDLAAMRARFGSGAPAARGR